MQETIKDIYKLIEIGIIVILLIIFIVIHRQIKKNDETILNDTSKNIIDENNLQKIEGYKNIYYYEIDLETY